MKKFHRFASLFIVLTLALSLCAVSASAVEQEDLSDDSIIALMMTSDDFEVKQSDDGAYTIMTASVPTEQLPRSVFARSSMNLSGTATALENSEFTFSCVDGEGTQCRLITTNVDDSWGLDVTYSYYDGEPVSLTENINAGKSRITVISNNKGEQLEFDIDVPIVADRAPSVDWKFSGEQY